MNLKRTISDEQLEKSIEFAGGWAANSRQDHRLWQKVLDYATELRSVIDQTQQPSVAEKWLLEQRIMADQSRAGACQGACANCRFSADDDCLLNDAVSVTRSMPEHVREYLAGLEAGSSKMETTEDGDFLSAPPSQLSYEAFAPAEPQSFAHHNTLLKAETSANSEAGNE